MPAKLIRKTASPILGSSSRAMTDRVEGGGVVCRVGATRFVLAVAAVREVCTGVGIVRVPGVAAPVEGVANVRGTLVTVIRGTAVVGGEPGVGESPWLVILNARAGRVGLGVDDVLSAAEATTSDRPIDLTAMLDRVLGEVKG